MKDVNIAFGSNLKALRQKHGYTRTKLAQMIDYSEKTIEKWEYNHSLPSVETVCKLADFFGVTIDSLVYTPKLEIKYLLAIDGGGTKTEFLLTDINKKEISHVILGVSNPVDIGIENTKKILEQGIREVCAGISLREVSVFAGIAGGMTGDHKQQINEFLSYFDFACFGNGSDTENVLEIALEGEDGVAVIMGTGIIAYSQVEGERHRIGGWGYHIDKGGSGYNFGSDAMYCALKYIDGRKGSKILCNLIEDKLCKPLPDSIADIHRGGKAFIASFAPTVFEAYNKGDEFAAEIIDRNIKEVAEIIIAGQKCFSKPNCKVVICGGLVHYMSVLDVFFKKYLGENINVTYCKDPVVDGALMIADKLKNGG